MIDAVSLGIILLESSIPLKLTYGITAAAYTTYLAGKKEMKSVLLALGIIFILSFQSVSSLENMIFITAYFFVFYLIFIYMEYRKGNMPLIAAIQTGMWFLLMKRAFEIKEAGIIFGLYLAMDIAYVILKRRVPGVKR